MGESDELFAEVGAMRDELEEQGSMINALVRASSKEVRDDLLEAFRKDPALRQIYMLVDGTNTQQQIVDILTEKGVSGASRSAVSNKLEKLRHEGLISRATRRKAGIVYRKTRLDQALGLSRELRK